ncbi:lipase [Rhodococcoides trifolii]|uniref:Lipase n=1 Tax=Rhodococcoides trifolii TaxID=908250 RepID=A0A917FQI0_9NOCA|nr:alpha/beta hydrolase [Rhodococcus trifolii]GGF96021.1 lipase [Rhodococcus trifolii]
MNAKIALVAAAMLLSITACAGPLGKITVGDHPELPTASAPALPAPTGDLPVGSTVVDLIDESRPDPWVPDERRELITTVWYPADPEGPNFVPAQYMTVDESTRFMATQSVDVPADVLSTVTTNSTPNAAPIPAERSRPLVVLSPGFSFPRATLTGLAEDFASRGYVVIGIDHVHESWGTSLPDGRVAECVACEGELDGPKVTSSRAQDISFVLDRFFGKDPMWPGAVSVDPNRIAVGGHSIGGSSALQTMLADPRVDSGFDLDGTLFPPLATDLDRPFLILEAESHPTQDTSLDETWEHLRGVREREVVPGTTHSSFTDLAPLADAVGTPLQKLAGDEAMRITRERTVRFLDRVFS